MFKKEGKDKKDLQLALPDKRKTPTLIWISENL
jgi:hypothetical protein